MSWARIVKNMSYSLRGWNAIIKIFLINCLSLLTNNTFPTKPQVAVGTIMLIILSKIFWSGWLWSPVASVTPTAVTPGAGPPCLPPHKASSSSWWQSILPGDSLGQPPCVSPPPPQSRSSWFAKTLFSRLGHSTWWPWWWPPSCSHPWRPFASSPMPIDSRGSTRQKARLYQRSGVREHVCLSSLCWWYWSPHPQILSQKDS